MVSHAPLFLLKSLLPSSHRIYSIKRRGVKKIRRPSNAELLNFKIKSHKLLTDNNYDKLFENKFQCLALLLRRLE